MDAMSIVWLLCSFIAFYREKNYVIFTGFTCSRNESILQCNIAKHILTRNRFHSHENVTKHRRNEYVVC